MNHGGAFSEWSSIIAFPSFEWGDGIWLPCWNVWGLLTISSPGQWTCHTFLSDLIFNVKYKFPMVFNFAFPVHQFTGLKCSLKSCPGWYLRESFNDTLQIHCFQKISWRHQLWQPRQGTHCLFQWINYGSLEKEGVGRGLPNSSAETNSHSPASTLKKTT